jgi:quercetin dioxygenase-like cupin family protein
MDDQELNRLLREWTAPAAPPGLRPPSAPAPWLRWLVAGTIRVPVPAALALVLVAAVWTATAWPASLPVRQQIPETTARPPSGELARYALTGPLEGFDAVLVELNFGPGSSTPEHRHPGFVLGYVVNGQLRSAIDHGPGEIVPAGGTFFEPSGALHTTFGAASPDAPARVVAFLVVPNGSPLTVRRETP